MPTETEYQELINNITSEWVTDYNGTGVSGRLFTAENGNTLFLPAAGIVSDGPFAQNSFGFYWSANGYENIGQNIGFSNDNKIYYNTNPRSSGYSIRGVKNAK